MWLPPAPRGTYYPLKKSKKDKKQKETSKPKVNLAKVNHAKAPESAPLDPVVASALEIANTQDVTEVNFDDFGFDFNDEDTFDLDGM